MSRASAAHCALPRLAAALPLVALIGLWPQAASADLIAHFGVGLKGGINVNLLSEPSEEMVDVPVPGFVGTSGGFGLAFEALALDIVGLEIDVMWVGTEGTGDIEIGASSFEQKITTSELHIPLLLKVQLPFGLVRPFLAGGIAFVYQTEADFEIDSDGIDTDYGDELASDYQMWVLALGAAIDLEVVRIPIEFRGMYQEIDPDPLTRVMFETAENSNTIVKMGVKPTWEGQVWVLVGVEFARGI